MSDNRDDLIMAALVKMQGILDRSEDKLDRHERLLHAIRDDITVNMGRADMAHKVAGNTRDELRTLGDLVTGMLRQIKRLQDDVRDLKGD